MNIETFWEWSTHRPLIQMVLQYFKPQQIVELGSGNFSTPLFVAYNPPRLVCYESENEWYLLNKERYPQLNIVHHRLPENITIHTKIHEITADEMCQIKRYYENVKNMVMQNDISPKMLFVDQFNCGRTISINTMFDTFDIIMYHDAQPEGIEWHSYYFNELLHSCYDHFTLKTRLSWTSMFVSKRLNYDFAEMHAVIQPFIDAYCYENGQLPKSVTFCHE
jgi:hypothetical protein